MTPFVSRACWAVPRVLGAAICLAAIWCGGVTSDKPSPAAPTPTVREFLSSYAEAYCAREDRCAPVLGRATASHAVCLAHFARVAEYERFFGGDDYYAGLALDYEVGDEAARAACFAALATGDCAAAEQSLDAACTAALKLRSPKQAGESCREASHASRGTPCAAGLLCLDGPGGCFVCTMPTTQNEPARAGLGDPCSEQNRCRGNLECPTPALSGGCTPHATTGEACRTKYDAPNFQPQCLLGLECDPVPDTDHGVCRPLGYVGDVCWRNPVSPQMPCDGWCLFPTADAAMGKCGVPPDNAQEHAPCVTFWHDSSLFCPHPYVGSAEEKQDGGFVACECLAQRPTGGPCTYDRHCAPTTAGAYAARCTGVDGGAGTCALPLPVGAACNRPIECASLTCDATTRRCTAPPAPPPACP